MNRTTPDRVWICFPLLAIALSTTIALSADVGEVENHGAKRKTAFSLPKGKLSVVEGAAKVPITNDRKMFAALLLKGDAEYLVVMPDGSLRKFSTDVVDLVDELPRNFEDYASAMQSLEKTRIFPGFRARNKGTRCREESTGRLRSFSISYYYRSSDHFLELAHNARQTLLPVVRKFCEQNELKYHYPQVAAKTILMKNKSEFFELFSPPKGVTGFYDVVSNTVVTFEDHDDIDLPERLKHHMAFTTVAHECVHELLVNMGVQQRLARWPGWVSEGLAEHLSAAASMSSGGAASAARFEHVHPVRMWQLAKFYPFEDTPARDKEIAALDGKRLRATIEAVQLSADDYAVAWALVRFLSARRSKEFRALLKQVHEFRPLEGAPTREEQAKSWNLALFTKKFGSDFAKLEREMVEYLANLKVEERKDDLPHYVGTLVTTEKRRVVRKLEVSVSRRAILKTTKEEAQAWLDKSYKAAHDFADKHDDIFVSVSRDVRTFATRLDAEYFMRNWLHERRRPSAVQPGLPRTRPPSSYRPPRVPSTPGYRPPRLPSSPRYRPPIRRP